MRLSLKRFVGLIKGDPFLLVFMFVFVFFMIPVFLAVFLHFQVGIDIPYLKMKNHTSAAFWGQLGDFVGGFLNPVLSFFAFLGLMATLRFQRREAAVADIKHEESQFDSRLFQMLGLLNSSIEKAYYSGDNFRFSGDFIFSHRAVYEGYKKLYSDVKGVYSSGDAKNVYEGAKFSYERWAGKEAIGLLSYFNTILCVVEYISEGGSDKDKRFALKVFISQLSQEARFILFYLLMFSEDYKTFNLLDEHGAWGKPMDDSIFLHARKIRYELVFRLTGLPPLDV